MLYLPLINILVRVTFWHYKYTLIATFICTSNLRPYSCQVLHTKAYLQCLNFDIFVWMAVHGTTLYIPRPLSQLLTQFSSIRNRFQELHRNEKFPNFNSVGDRNFKTGKPILPSIFLLKNVVLLSLFLFQFPPPLYIDFLSGFCQFSSDLRMCPRILRLKRI